MLPEFILSANAILWITAVIALSIGLIVKDILSNFTSGVMFYLNKTFNEGDHAYLDGQICIIVKIGLRFTVFEFEKDGHKCWRYIANDRVKYLTLEKIISIKQEK